MASDFELPGSTMSLLRRYFRLLGLTQRLSRGFRQHQLGDDHGRAHLVLLVIALLCTGRGGASTCATSPAMRCSRGSVVSPVFAAIAL